MEELDMVDQIFEDYCNQLIPNFDELPEAIQKTLKSTFHAGIITTLNSSKPVIDALLLGRNVELVKLAIVTDENSDNIINTFQLEFDSEIEMKKVANDFNLYIESREIYDALVSSSKDYIEANTAINKNNVVDIGLNPRKGKT